MLTTVDSRKEQMIRAWDFSSVVAYLLDKHLAETREEALELVEEYRRFVILNAEHPLAKLPISHAVDKVWHAHILHTRDYRKFGEKVFGRYLDHEPTHNKQESQRLAHDYAKNTIPLYRERFGELSHHWVMDAQVCITPPCEDGS